MNFRREPPAQGCLRDQILMAVREIVAEEGWHGLTMRKIAQRIRYSPPMIYEHFASKDAIHGALVLHGFQLLYRYLSTATAGLPKPERRLQAAIRAIRTFAWENPEYYQAMYGMSGAEPAEGAEYHETSGACLGLLGDALAQAMQVGLLREMPPLQAAKALLATAHGVIALHLARRIPERPEAEALYDHLFATLLAGWKA